MEGKAPIAFVIHGQSFLLQVSENLKKWVENFAKETATDTQKIYAKAFIEDFLDRKTRVIIRQRADKILLRFIRELVEKRVDLATLR